MSMQNQEAGTSLRGMRPDWAGLGAGGLHIVRRPAVADSLRIRCGLADFADTLHLGGGREMRARSLRLRRAEIGAAASIDDSTVTPIVITGPEITTRGANCPLGEGSNHRNGES
jgi:hypothetical protein